MVSAILRQIYAMPAGIAARVQGLAAICAAARRTWQSVPRQSAGWCNRLQRLLCWDMTARMRCRADGQSPIIFKAVWKITYC